MIPLILGAAAVGSGLYGAYKGIKGAVDQSNASDINSDAASMVDKANATVEKRRETATLTLTYYGEHKLRAFQGPIHNFTETFGRLKNVELIQIPELEKLQLDSSTQMLAGLEQNYQALEAAGLGLGAGLGSGAALAFGAYNGTMLLATASTGTAISTLSGVAATNATLAWLGGGSLATGGFGMAGGMMVLGGIVAGPALAIFGHIVGNKGEEALNKARSNMEQAKTIRDAASVMADKLQAIGQVTGLADETLSHISAQLRRSVNALHGVIEKQGEDYRTFAQEPRDVVFRAVKFAQLIKAMIDAPILDEDGNLVLATEKRVEDIGKASGAARALADQAAST